MALREPPKGALTEHQKSGSGQYIDDSKVGVSVYGVTQWKW